MSDRVDISLKEDPGKKPKGFWRRIAGYLSKKLAGLADSGCEIVDGIAHERSAKVRQIDKGILDQKERLELEKEKERNRAAERMKELQIEENLKDAEAEKMRAEAEADKLRAKAEAFKTVQQLFMEAEEKGIKLVGLTLPMLKDGQPRSANPEKQIPSTETVPDDKLAREVEKE